MRRGTPTPTTTATTAPAMAMATAPRRSAFALACFALVTLAAATGRPAHAADAALPSRWSTPATTLDPATLPRPYALVARPASGERGNGIDVVALDPKTLEPVARSPLALACARVHASRAGQVACLTRRAPGEGPAEPAALQVLSPALQLLARRTVPTDGIPSRARASGDGAFVATTQFVTGHAYGGAGGVAFSTATYLWRNDSQRPPENLQDWPVLRANGDPVGAIDLNLWGVTFDPADSDHFYVTAYYEGRARLAEGRVKARRITTVRDDRVVECPSLSPDGRRLAFKRRTGATSWSPAVLDLATMKERVFDIGRSVDDQIEWIDAHRLVFEVVARPLVGAPTTDLLTIDVDAASPAARTWLANARSPAFVVAAPAR